MSAVAAAQNPTANVTVNVNAGRHPIDPRIYGLAYGTTAQLTDLHVPLNGYGGNNSSRYNWQLNADNRAQDWYYESIGETSATAGERGDTIFSLSKAAGAQAMLTVPMIGWIAKLGANDPKAKDLQRQVDELWKKQMDTIGIRIVFRKDKLPELRKMARQGKIQTRGDGWIADYPTYGNFMLDLYGAASIGGNNLGSFKDAKFDEILAKAQAETDDTKRAELYQQSEDYLLNTQVAAVPLNWYVGDQVYAKNVVGYSEPPLTAIMWERVGIKK